MRSYEVVITALLLGSLCMLSGYLIQREKKLSFYEGRQSVFKELSSPNCLNLLGCLSEEYTR